MQKTQNLQDAFLNYIRREKIPVTLFLMNGFQLRGRSRSNCRADLPAAPRRKEGRI